MAKTAIYVNSSYDSTTEGWGVTRFSSQFKPVAKIGTTKYASLADAVAAVKDGETIELLVADINEKFPAYDSAKSFTVKGLATGTGIAGTVSTAGEQGWYENGVTFENINWTKQFQMRKLEDVTFKNCKFTGACGIYYCYVASTGEVTLKDCEINSPVYGVHFDENNGIVNIDNCTITSWNSMSGTGKLNISNSVVDTGKDYAMLRPYLNTTITNTKFTEAFAAAVKDGQGISVAGNNTLVELNGCSVIKSKTDQTVSTEYVLTDLFSDFQYDTSLVAIDSVKGDNGYTAGTFVAESVSTLNKACDDSIDIDFLGAANYEGRFVYAVSDTAKALTAEGTLSGTIKVPQDVTFSIKSGATITDGTKIYVPYDEGSQALADWKTANIPAETSCTVNGFMSKIGDNGYYTLADAYAAAESGDTVKLLVDTIDSINGIPADVTLEGVADKTTVTSSMEWQDFSGDTTIKNIKFAGESNGIRWGYIKSGTLTIDNCDFAQTAGSEAYGIHFDELSGNLVVKNSNITGTVACSETSKSISFVGDTFAGRGNSGKCNINFYSDASFDGCTFSDDYCSGSSRGILMVNGTEVVELKNCTLSNAQSQYKITDIIRRDCVGIAAFDATKGDSGYTAGTFVAKDVATLNAACEDSIDIDFVNAANYEGTLVYKTASKTVSLEGTITAKATVPEDFVIDQFQMTDGVNLYLDSRTCLAEGDYQIGPQSIIFINEYMTDDELQAWKDARVLDANEIVRPLSGSVAEPIVEEKIDTTTEPGKTIVTETATHVVNIGTAETLVEDMSAPLSHEEVTVADTDTYKETWINPVGNVIINSVVEDVTDTTEVRGKVEQKNESYNLIVNNYNAEKQESTGDVKTTGGVMEITGELKAVDTIIINNGNADAEGEAKMYGLNDTVGFKTDSKNLIINNVGHMVIEATASDKVTIHNNSMNTLKGEVAGETILIDGTGKIEDATVTGYDTVTVEDAQTLVNSKIETSEFINGTEDKGATTTMDHASQIVWSDSFDSEYGTIAVDTAKATLAIYKVVDSKDGNAADYDNVSVTGNTSYVLYEDGDEGDLYIFNQDLISYATFVVSADWSTKEFGDAVQVGETYYFIGLNAFSSMTDANDSLAAATTTIQGVNHTSTESEEFVVQNRTITFSGTVNSSKFELSVDANSGKRSAELNFAADADYTLNSLSTANDGGSETINIGVAGASTRAKVNAQNIADQGVNTHFNIVNADVTAKDYEVYGEDNNVKSGATLTTETLEVYEDASFYVQGATATVTNKMTAAADSEVIIEDATFTAAELVNNTELSVSGKSVLDVKLSGDGSVKIAGGSDISGSVSDTGTNDLEIIGKKSKITGTVSVGGSATIGQSASAASTTVSGSVTAVGDFTVGYATKYVADLTVSGSTSYVGSTEGALVINGGTSAATVNKVTLKDGGRLQFKTNFTNDGTITVDAPTTSDSYLLVENLGTSAKTLADFGTVNLSSAMTNAGYITILSNASGSELNDLYAVKIDAKKLYVNEAWSNYAIGTKVIIGAGTAEEKTLYVGYNAFGQMADAVARINTIGAAGALPSDITVLEGNVGTKETATGEGTEFTLAGTYNVHGTDWANVGYLQLNPSKASSATRYVLNIDGSNLTMTKPQLRKSSDLNITDSHVDFAVQPNGSKGYLFVFGDSTATIDNSVVGYFTDGTNHSDAVVAGQESTNTDGMMAAYISGTFSAGTSTVFTMTTDSKNNAFAIYDRGLATFEDSVLYSGNITIGDYEAGRSDRDTVGRDGEIATISLDKSKIIKNLADTYALKIGDDKAGKLILKNGSEVAFADVDATVNTNGTVDISGSTMTVAKLTNNGAFNVSGTSKLSASSFAGNLTVGKDDEETILTTDGLVAKGANLLKLVDGSTVTLSGNGFDLDYNDDGDYMMIENAAEEKNSWDAQGNLNHIGNTLNITNVTESFKAYALYNNANSVINVTDNTGTIKTEFINIYGGTFNMTGGTMAVDQHINVTGEMNLSGVTANISYVDVYAGNADGYNGGKLNITNSTVDGSDYQMIVGGTRNKAEYYEKGTDGSAVITLTNSTLKSSDLLNKGTITIDATSQIVLKASGEASFAGVYNVADNGCITVDMTGGTAALYKLVDAVAASNYGTEGTNYKFISGKDNGYTLTVKDNDLYASNVSATTLLVNAAWAGTAIGTEVETGYYYGFNAFSTGADVSAAVDATTTKIVAYGNTTSVGALTINQDLTIETAGTDTASARFDSITVASGKKLTVAAGSNLDGGTIAPTGKFYLSGTTKFSGTIANSTASVDMFYLADGTTLTTDGFTTSGSKYIYMNVVDGAEATLSGAGFDLSAVGISVENGSKLSISEATDLKAKAWFIMSGSEVEFDNTVTAKAAQMSMNISADSLVTVKNGSTLWANNTLNSYGRTVVEEGNTLKSPYIVVCGDTRADYASGLITVTGGTVESGSLRIGQTTTGSDYVAKLDSAGNNNKDAKVVLTDSTFTSTHTNSRRVVEVGTDSITGVLELNNSTFGANYTEKAVQKGPNYHFTVGAKGEVVLNGTSTVDWREAIDNAGSITLNGTSKILHESTDDNAEAIANTGTITLNDSASISSAKGITNSGSIVLVGSTAGSNAAITGTVTNTGTVEFNAFKTDLTAATPKITIEQSTGSTYALKNGAEITAGDLTSSITVDASSKLTANSIALGSGQTLSIALNPEAVTVVSGSVANSAGTITVDMTGATAATYKLISSTNTASYGNYDFATGKDYGYTLTVNGNDLWATKISANNLAVNHDWVGTAIGTEVVLGGTSYYYGFNAFANMADATQAASTTEATSIVVGGSSTIPSTSYVGGGQDITVSGTATFDWEGWMFLNRKVAWGDPSKTAKVTFSGATITRDTTKVGGGDCSIQINGAKDEYADRNGNGQLDVINGSDITAEWVIDKNVLNVNTGSKFTATTYLNVAGRPASEAPSGEDATAYLNIDNATVNAKGSSNSSGLTIGDEGKGEVNLTNNAKLNAKKITATAKSTINVTNSEITVDDTFANEGTVIVSGTSKLSAKSFTGDLNVGGTAATVLTTDGLTMTGDNIFVADGSTVTLSGNGFNLIGPRSAQGAITNGAIFKDSADTYNTTPHAGYTLNIKDADAFNAYAIYDNGGSVVNVTNVKDFALNVLNVYGGEFNITGTDKAQYKAAAEDTLNVTGAVTVSKASMTAGNLHVYAAPTDLMGGTVTATDAQVDARFVDIGTSVTGGTKYIGGTSQAAEMNLSNSKLVIHNVPGESASTLAVGGTDTVGTLNLTSASVERKYTEPAFYTDVNITVGAKGTINATDSSIDTDTLANYGTITIDGTSALSAATITSTGTISLAKGGSISVSSGISGAVTLSDAATVDCVKVASYTGSGEYAFSNLSVTNEGFSIFVDGNDAYATNADQTTYKVNSAWTGSYGTKVADGYYMGINAFNSAKTALESLADVTTTVDVIGTDTEEVKSPVIKLDQDLLISGGTINWTFSGMDEKAPGDDGVVYFLRAASAEDMPTVTVAEGTVLNAAYTKGKKNGALYIGYNTSEAVELVVNGTVNSYVLYTSIGSKLTVNSTGKLNTGSEDLIVRRYATVSIDGTSGSWSEANVQADFGYVELQGGTTTFKNTFVDGGAWIDFWNRNNLSDDCPTLVLDNANVVTGKFVGGTTTAAKNALTNVTNGSKLTVSGDIAIGAKDEFNVSGSTVTAASITNNGTVNVTGASTISATSVAGNGVYNLNDGAALKDSKIGTTNVFGTASLSDSTVGTVNIGFETATTTSDTLNITGTNATGNIYVGQADLDDAKDVEGWENRKYALNITGGTSALGQVYIRTTGTVKVDNANVTAGYQCIYGALNINNGATYTVDSANFYVVGRDSKKAKDKAIVTVDGSTLNFNNAVALALGGGDSGYIGSGKLVLKNKATANGTNITLDDNDGTLGTIAVEATDSTINLTGELKIGTGDYVSLSGSTATVGTTLTNKGEVTVSGSTLSAASITNNGTVNVTGASAITANISQGANGVLNLGTVDTAFTGTLTGDVIGSDAGDNKGYVNLVNGSLAMVDQDIFVKNITIGSRTKGVVTKDTTAVITVDKDSTLNAVVDNGIWIGAADGELETAADNSKQFKLLINGGTASAGRSGFSVRNTGYLAITAGGSFTAPDAVYRNDVLVSGEGSTLTETMGNLYGETNINATMTVENNATANLGSFVLGSNGEKRANRQGTLTIDSATVTATDFSISAKNSDEAAYRGFINMTDGTLTVSGTLTNAGAISMDTASSITVGAFTNNSGTISVNVASTDVKSKYLLVNNTGSAEMTLASYGTVTLTGAGAENYTATVIGNDLYAVRNDAFDGLFYSPNWADGEAVEVTFHDVVYSGTVGDGVFYKDINAVVSAAKTASKTIAAVGTGTISSFQIFNGASVTIAPDPAEAVTGTYSKMTIMGYNTGNSSSIWTSYNDAYTTTIDGGVFKASFIAGDTMASSVGTNANGCFIDRTTVVTTTVNGGTFTKRFTGGSYYGVSGTYAGKQNTYLGIGGVNLTINGGNFGTQRFYAGNSDIYEAYTSSTVVSGDINFTINAKSAISFGEHVICGSQGSGRVGGNVNVTITGDGANLTFGSDSILWGGCSGDLFFTSSDTGVRSVSTSVYGSRNVTFSDFTGDFGARVAMFDTLTLSDGTDVDFTSGAVNWREVKTWNLACDSVANLGSGANDFAGDAINVDITGWDESATTLLTGTNWTGFDLDSNAVKLGGEIAAWDSENEKWYSTSYQLQVEGDNLVFSKKLA